jgi:hypothetical protein
MLAYTLLGLLVYAVLLAALVLLLFHGREPN